MNDKDLVRLVVNGVEFAGWKSVRIEAGIERAARSFDLGVTDTWPGSATVRNKVQPGSLCELWIGSDKVLTGYVDATPISYDGSSYTVGVKGRSKTADLVDCSATNTPGQWRNARVEAIAQAMASVYGVSVVAGITTGSSVSDHQIKPGESVFESIDRMLTLRQLLATDDGDGRLVLIQAGSGGKAKTALALGGNIRDGQCDLDYSKVYSHYVCKGQRATVEDEDMTPEVSEQVGVSVQAGVRHRVLIIKQSGQADGEACQDRADYENTYRAAKARQASYTVDGWRQESGELWMPNQTARVRDGLIGIDEDLLITEVAWSLDGGGMSTEIKVCPIDGFLNRRVKTAKKKSGGDSGDSWADIK